MRRFVVTRRAREMAERLLGLGALRLTEPPDDWWGGEEACDVGSPSSVEGFLLVHAGASPERVWAARARAKAEAARPLLRQARELGLFPEGTMRLLAVKSTADADAEWMAAGVEARATGDFTEVNRLLRAAVRPAPAPPAESAAPPAPPDAPLNAERTTLNERPAPRSDTPATVRARLATQRDERARGLAPTTVLHLDRKVPFDAWQHDAWWQAAQRVRGESAATPTASLVFTTMLDHFGEAGAALLAPASRADLEPERRVFVDPVPVSGPDGARHRAWLSTNRARCAIDAGAIERGGTRPPKVVVRKARGKNVAPTESALRAEFPELFWDPSSEECRSRVRALLGYPLDQTATWPEPPVPAEIAQRHRPAPVAEDEVDPAIVEQLDPGADALPELDAVQTRAVTASAPRVGESLRWHELAALAALHGAEQRGERPTGTVRRACEAEGMSERSRQEARWTWERLVTRPALAAAFQAGLDYSMVRALARVEPEVVQAWIAFAHGRSVAVVEAHLAAAGPNGLPPVTPTGMDPLLPVGATVTEDIHVDLNPAQQQTLARLRAMLGRLLGRRLTDPELYAAIAGWYVRRRTGVKRPRDTVVYQRSPETRVPIELRREARPGAAGGAQSVIERHLPWVLAPSASGSGGCPPPPRLRRASAMAPLAQRAQRGDGGWVDPVQSPGQDYVPVATREAVLDRDGHRCTTWFCPHNLVPTYNHGTWRRVGGMANPDDDQMQCLPCNNDHSLGMLVDDYRPDGGVWCWDGAGRPHGTVAPVARHLDAPLRQRLLSLAEARLASAPAQRFTLPARGHPPPAPAPCGT